MANGFTQRWKGKVAAVQLWVAGVPQNGPQAVVAYSTAGTQTLAGSGAIETINASSAISIWTMGYGPTPGREQVIDLITVSSGAFIKAAAGASFDPSTNTVIKSTYAESITLLGLSTTKWAIKSVFPGTTLGGSGITLSTTT